MASAQLSLADKSEEMDSPITKEVYDKQSQKYEAKITELHSIIAEMSKKLNIRQENLIRENVSDEGDTESEKSTSQERSASNRNNLNGRCPNMTVSSHFPSAVLESGSSSKNHCDKLMWQHQPKLNFEDEVQSKRSESPSNLLQKHPDTCNIWKLAKLQKEILLLKGDNDALHDQIGYQESELNKAKAAVGSLREERDRLRRKIRELHSKVQGFQSQSSQGSQTASPARSRSSKVNSAPGETLSPAHQGDVPITKIAERVKLKRMKNAERHISGSEISSLGVSNAKVVHHLVQHFQEESNAQEIVQALYSSGSQVPESRIEEFEVETERLNSKIEHLKSQYDLLCLTLDESKMHCDNLTVLIGKYESNNTALQLALTYSDQAVDVCETLVKLIQTEMEVLIGTNHVAGLTQWTDVGLCDGHCVENDVECVVLKRMEDIRKEAKVITRHRLESVEKHCGFKNVNDGYPKSSPCLNARKIDSSVEEALKMEENQLRHCLAWLKNERSTVRMTIMELETFQIEQLPPEANTTADTQKMDLENAVLIQELMAIKEEKGELKAQLYALEKERAALELRLSGRESREQAYITHVEHLKHELKEKHQNVENGDGRQFNIVDESEDLSQNLVEAFQREKKLKMRIQELVSTLEKVTCHSESKNQRSTEFVNDLKSANSALISTFESTKKKYESKLKRMEEHVASIQERHNAQVRILQNKIMLLEETVNAQNVQLATETTI